MDRQVTYLLFGAAIAVVALGVYKRNYGNTVTPLYRSANSTNKAVLAQNMISDPSAYDSSFKPNIDNPADNDQILKQ